MAAYNTEVSPLRLVARVREMDLSRFGMRKEVMAIDDGSTDDTAQIAGAVPEVVLHCLDGSRGKGAAVRAGIGCSRGNLILIQDADLEYDPVDCAPTVEQVFATGAEAVYGSRYLRPGGGRERGRRHPGQSAAAYWGGRSLSLAVLACTGRWLTDTATALKLFRRETLAPLCLETSGFELDHEITCKVLARGGRIEEVPVSYAPRSRAEGKKIGARDWLRALAAYRAYRHG